MKVKLASCGNPDYPGQDPNRPLYGAERNRTVRVKDLKEAQQVCRAFIVRNHLGGGNWAGGEVLDDDGKIIAKVGFNGRVWTPEPWPHCKEIQV